MNKRHKDDYGASALRVSLAAVLSFVIAILFSVPFVAAPLRKRAAPVSDHSTVTPNQARDFKGQGGLEPTATPSPTPPPAVCSFDEPFDVISQLPNRGWVVRNNSAPTGLTGWFEGNTAVFTGNPDPYLATGSSAGAGVATINNWLLSPPVTLYRGGILRFRTRTVNSPTRPDRLQVLMSPNGTGTDVGTTATSVGDFNLLLFDLNSTYTTTAYPNTWTEYAVSVWQEIDPPITGRFGFRYFVENAGPGGINSDYIGIDNVSYDCGLPPATPSPTPIKGEITLVSRMSEATATAQNHSAGDHPPPQSQHDFAPANLKNFASVFGESGSGTGHSISNSSITVHSAKRTLVVTGDGMANSDTALKNPSATAGAKLIVLTFRIKDFSTDYLLTGQITRNNLFGATGRAKLTDEGGTLLFEVVADENAPESVPLSETGTIPPGSYTLAVELESHVWGRVGDTFGGGTAHSGGNFTFMLTEAGTPTPSPTPTPTAGETRAENLSTRLFVRTGADVGIGGFIITGGPKQVLLRGIGPSLGSVGVSNPLADPRLELQGPIGFSTVTNNNWRNTQEAEIIASGIAPTNDLESAILVTLDPGPYTAILKGDSDGVGVGLVEIYDLSQGSASRLGNLSTRAFVSTGSDIVIAGFILGGGKNDDTVLLRGLGPSLIGSGVPNALANPTLELRNSDGAVIAMNDDWQSGSLASLPPSDPLESAIETALLPGAYTALLSGVNNGTGVGLVEVYDRGSLAH